MKLLQHFILNNIIKYQKEHFKSDKNIVDNISYYQMISFLITFFITQLILLLIGKFLWNNYLVNITTVVKPVKNITEILAISVLFNLLF